MAASSRDLAAALVVRLEPVIPDQFLLRADGGDVIVTSPDGTESILGACRILEDDDDRSTEEKASTAVWQVVNGLQDDVVRTLRKPWPERSNSRDLVLPDVDAIGETVRWWFGDSAAPVLTLPPIPFAEFVRADR